MNTTSCDVHRDLEKEIEALRKRNERVEIDKAWETSWTRRLLILGLTYTVVGLFFSRAQLAQPWINACVPTLGYFLSTLTVPIIKRWWVQHMHTKT